MFGGVLDWETLLESRADTNGYKQILTEFRGNCQAVGLTEYMTMKVTTLSPKDLAVFINFADGLREDDTGGFTTKIGDKEITVTKKYLQDVLKMPQEEEGEALPDKSEDYNAFYDSCLLPTTKAANRSDHLKRNLMIQGWSDVAGVIQELFENKSGSKDQMSGFAWKMMYHIYRRDKKYDYTDHLLTEMTKVVRRTKIAKSEDGKRVFTPAPSHTVRFQLIMNHEGVEQTEEIGRAHV